MSLLLDGSLLHTCEHAVVDKITLLDRRDGMGNLARGAEPPHKAAQQGSKERQIANQSPRSIVSQEAEDSSVRKSNTNERQCSQSAAKSSTSQQMSDISEVESVLNSKLAAGKPVSRHLWMNMLSSTKMGRDYVASILACQRHPLRTQYLILYNLKSSDTAI